MIDPQDLWATDEEVKAHLARKDGNKKPRPKKESKVGFLKFDVPFLHKLIDDKAGRAVWAMVCALQEAWFTTGIYSQHLNPFPLSAVEMERWGLKYRIQKHRALEFLIRTRLINVDRRDPKNPLVTLAWVPLYQPKA
jgi:hypothetical protein